MKMDKNTVGRCTGRYDFLHENEKQVQFYFRLRPGSTFRNNTANFYLPEDCDIDAYTYRPVDTARELLAYIKEKYLFSSATKELETLIAYLEIWEHEDAADGLRETVAHMEKELLNLKRELDSEENYWQYYLEDLEY